MALFGALTLAELAGALPRSGGIFAYLLETFGPLPAFVFGWTELTVIRASALGATATIFAEYVGYYVALTPGQVRYVAAAAIVAIGALNYFGAQRAAVLMSFSTAGKFAAVLALGLLAFTAGTGSASHFSPLWGSGLNLSLLGTALIPVLWTYDGWADLSFMGGEVRNPQRTLPLALVLGTVCVMLAYVVVNLGFMYLLPLPQMAQSKLIAATAAEHIPLLGNAGASLIAAVVLVSSISGLNGSMMTGPRIFFAMAEQGLFFRARSPRVAANSARPSVAIWLATALGVVYVLTNGFAQLADRFILGIWPFYALCVAGVFVLRRRRPELPRPYRVPGYPVVPALFPAGLVRHDRECARDRSLEHRRHVRHHRGWNPRLLPLERYGRARRTRSQSSTIAVRPCARCHRSAAPVLHRLLAGALGGAPAAVRLHARDGRRGAGDRAAFRRAAQPRADDRLAEAAVRGAQPGRLPARQGQRGVGSGPVPAVGLGCGDRVLRGALSDAQASSAGADGADALRRQSHRGADPGRCHLGARRRDACVQRVWRGRRCDRRARVCQLRHGR